MDKNRDAEHRDTGAQASSGAQGVRRAVYRSMPNEGEGGVYSQSWFPVCLDRKSVV